MNHVQFSWIYSMGTWPPAGTWVAKAAKNSPDSMPIGRHCPSPCVTNRVCEPPVFFIPYDSYGCVQKKQGVYTPKPTTINHEHA